MYCASSDSEYKRAVCAVGVPRKFSFSSISFAPAERYESMTAAIPSGSAPRNRPTALALSATMTRSVPARSESNVR